MSTAVATEPIPNKTIRKVPRHSPVSAARIAPTHQWVLIYEPEESGWHSFGLYLRTTRRPALGRAVANRGWIEQPGQLLVDQGEPVSVNAVIDPALIHWIPSSLHQAGIAELAQVVAYQILRQLELFGQFTVADFTRHKREENTAPRRIADQPQELCGGRRSIRPLGSETGNSTIIDIVRRITARVQIT